LRPRQTTIERNKRTATKPSHKRHCAVELGGAAMRRVTCVCIALACLTAWAQAGYLDDHVDYAKNRFIVKLWPDIGDLNPMDDGAFVRVSDTYLTALNRKWRVIQVERLFNGSGPKETPEIDLPGYWRFWLARPVDLETILSEYATAAIVEHVEPVGVHPVCYSPNDPSWPAQWYLRNTTFDHDIDAVEGWDVERGDSTVILGIVDTGVQYSHPDLLAGMWRNWPEVNGTPGYDDDGNGLVDDTVGWDWVNGIGGCADGEDCDDPDADPKDFNGHGTHCAGIAAARTNNGVGVAGIAGGGGEYTGARILAQRVGWTDSEGGGFVDMSFCAQAIDYARQKGACAVNCSWGSSNSGGIGAAVDAAIAAGMVICVAAGNDNSPYQSYLATRDDCIDIAATDANDVRASFSNYGDWVDVSAPGVNIYSTYSNQYQNTYASLQGTSMAAPCVTGEVGLLKSLYPAWTGSEITDAIINNVDYIYDENPGWEDLLGTGRINLGRALLSQSGITILRPNGGEVWAVGETDTIRWRSDNFTGDVNISVNRSYPYGFWQNIATNVPGTGEYSWQATAPTSTQARIRVLAASDPTLGDTSDGDFTILPTRILVEYPNGGESWCAGQTETITWRGAHLGGTVTISLNRNFPSGPWQTLFSNISNDEHEAWVVSGTASTAARIRVVSDSDPSRRDSSDGNFTIISPCIDVTSPTGGETWAIGETHAITWTAGGLAGNVEIAVNRNYPAAAWETIFANTANDGMQNWVVAGFPSFRNRIRVKSVSDPNVYAISESDFWIIQPNEAPQIVHDPLHDSWEPEAMVTAIVTDDSLPVPPGIQLYYRIEGAPVYSRTIMEPTGYTDEYAAYLASLSEGRYEYYICAVDMLGAADSTQILQFDVGVLCEEELAFDDGEGEGFDWMADTDFRWAVKFSPESYPFVLCGARFSVARSQPESSHEPVLVEVYADEAGLPGALIHSEITGSVGNVVGGLPEDIPLWADVVVHNNGFPVMLEGEFFIAVSNPESYGYEAFGRDTTGENYDRSYFFDPGDGLWHNENDAVPNAHPGNRLIRAIGYATYPPDAFSLLSPLNGDTVWTITPTLDWEDASSPDPNDELDYVVYWSQDSTFTAGVDSLVTDSSFYAFDEGELLGLPRSGTNGTLDDELPDDVTIYWRVRARNQVGATRWGTPEMGWHFAVFQREAPDPFSLLSPADETILNVTEADLSWEATSDPDPGDSVAFYRVYVAEDSLFSQADSYDVVGTTTHVSALEHNYTYWWKVHAYDTYGLWQPSTEIWSFSVALSVPEDASGVPKDFAMEQNYPNPFNPTTTIRIAIPKSSRVVVEVYDILGRTVAKLADREFSPGYHSLSWGCRTCAAGIYFIHMRAENFVQTRKMLIVK